MTTENVKKPNKTAAAVTYVIALLVIIGGWFIPLLGSSEIPLIDRMPFWYLPDALNAALGKSLITGNWITEHPLPAFDAFTVDYFGVDFCPLAILYLAYAAVTVFALIMLIPVLAGKKDKSTSLNCAYVVEILAVLVVTVFFVMSAYNGPINGVAVFSTLGNHLPLLIVGGAIIVVLCLQSIITKKGLGALKVVSLLLSAIAFVSLFDVFGVVTYFAGADIANSVSDLLVKINSGLFFMSLASIPLCAAYVGLYYLTNPAFIGEILTDSAIGTGDKILLIALLVIVVIAAVNFLLDFIGLSVGKKYAANGAESPRTGAKVFSLIRYSLALIAAATAIITIFSINAESYKPGAYLYVFTIISLIQVIIGIIRVCRVKSLKERYEDKEESLMKFSDSELSAERTEETQIISEQPVVPAEEEITPYEESAEEPITEQYAEEETAEDTVEAVVEEPTEEEPVAEPVEEVAEDPVEAEEDIPSEPTIRTVAEEIEQTDEQLTIPVGDADAAQSAEPPVRKVIYNVQTVYSGPTDAFMDTLTNEEKVEFTKVFIKKTKGELPADLPDYEIGGNNEDFFPVVFIYLGKFRAMLSRGLLGKIYRQLNNKN